MQPLIGAPLNTKYQHPHSSAEPRGAVVETTPRSGSRAAGRGLSKEWLPLSCRSELAGRRHLDGRRRGAALAADSLHLLDHVHALGHLAKDAVPARSKAKEPTGFLEASLFTFLEPFVQLLEAARSSSRGGGWAVAGRPAAGPHSASAELHGASQQARAE